MRYRFATLEDAMKFVCERIDPVIDEAMEQQAAYLLDAGATEDELEAEMARVRAETSRRRDATLREVSRWIENPDAPSSVEH